MTEPAAPVAFAFRVTFGGGPQDVDAAFAEVSGIAPEFEVETVAEGGENRFSHRLPKAAKHPLLTLRRGIAAADSPLVAWCRDTLEGGLAQPIEPRLVQVFLTDAAGDPLRAWSFDRAWPVKWEVDGFDASKNALALERIELAYAYSKRER